jgi:hypothetical protein
VELKKQSLSKNPCKTLSRSWFIFHLFFFVSLRFLYTQVVFLYFCFLSFFSKCDLVLTSCILRWPIYCFFSVTVQLMVIMAERLDLAFMLKRKVKFKSLFFFFLCSWKIGNLRMVHLCFIAFLGVWTLNIYRGAWSWNYCYFCYFCLRIVDFERMDWFWIYCMRI